uniref:Uncharacterized protein n=1 Tax=Anguilla anguilla TaxID=7936 RepID=A0A0E9PN14_ANGAN
MEMTLPLKYSHGFMDSQFQVIQGQIILYHYLPDHLRNCFVLHVRSINYLIKNHQIVYQL